MKFRFWHKMTAIFGFLDEKCIEMEIFIITSWLFRIMTSLKLSQLYRDLYGKMAFWPQWRHQLGAANLWQATVAEEKQLLSCICFCSSGFFRYFLPFWYWKWWQFPFNLSDRTNFLNFYQLVSQQYLSITISTFEPSPNVTQGI